MQESNWQAEKKKIVTRLSIAIYKMADEELVSLLHLFKDMPLDKQSGLPDISRLPFSEAGGHRNRQMLIAQFLLLINRLSESELQEFMNRYEQKRFSMLREYPRFACDFSLDLAVDGRAVSCFARDISANGIFVESCEPFVIGQSVSICFTMDDKGLALKLKGRVVRLEHGGAGIKYEAMTNYQLDIMKDIVKRLNA